MNPDTYNLTKCLYMDYMTIEGKCKDKLSEYCDDDIDINDWFKITMEIRNLFMNSRVSIKFPISNKSKIDTMVEVILTNIFDIESQSVEVKREAYRRINELIVFWKLK